MVSTTTTISKEINDLTWKITLVNSEVITGSQQNFYLKLNSTGTFESKAGCNQINGDFQINNQFISFSKIVTTKMFCANTMAIENSFISILNKTHKIVVIDTSKFILLQDDMVIAQFELVK